VRLAAVAQGEQHHLEIDPGLARRRSDEPDHHARRVVRHDVEAAACLRRIGVRPQACERAVFQLASEQGAQPGAGQANDGPAIAIELQDEGVGKDVPDRAGLDLGAIGRGAGAPERVPVREQHARRRLFHSPPGYGVFAPRTVPFWARLPRLATGERAFRASEESECRGYAGAGAMGIETLS
jgi:hypothetical protein